MVEPVDATSAAVGEASTATGVSTASQSQEPKKWSLPPPKSGFAESVFTALSVHCFAVRTL